MTDWIAVESDRRTIWPAELAGEPVGMAVGSTGSGGL